MKTKKCKAKHHLSDRNVSISNFSKHPNTKDKLQSYCKVCMSDAQRNWYTAEKQKKNSDAWWTKKRDNILSETGIWYNSPIAFLKAESPERYLLRRAKANAKQLKLKCNLTINDIVLPTQCPVLGISLFFSDGETTENTPSIDRIDPDKGYMKGNIAIVSWRANRIKNNGTPDEHRLIYEFYKPLTITQ